MTCRLRIGLTGGIASGKTEASRRFAELGVPVIDTDLIARELVNPGQPALAEIADQFGDAVIAPGGGLDRARLRAIVFSDAGRRRQLERILHPRIREKALSEADRLDAPYCILVIPLLVETATDYPLDRILVIDAPTELQIERLRHRDSLSEADIAAILTAQTSRETRLKAADDVVVNAGTTDELREKIDALHRRYLQLASSRSH
ncbi:MAG: dephospho-CoA kinase [Gammaproteobacteria bacterium]|jgi:dephospho-CoA kinase